MDLRGLPVPGHEPRWFDPRSGAILAATPDLAAPPSADTSRPDDWVLFVAAPFEPVP